MAEPLRGTFGAGAARLSHLAPLFARMADGTLRHWRRALGVPDQARAEVEAELIAQRKKLDERFAPEFRSR